MSEDSTTRWIDLLAALRAEHLARLHAFSRQVALAALGLSATIAIGVMLGLDVLGDVSFGDSELGLLLALVGAALFAAACGVITLALYQQRRDRMAAIAHLDRAIPRLIGGTELPGVLAELSEGMRKLAPARYEAGPSPYLPSVLDTRWLGTTVYTKVFLACALLLIATLLVASAAVLVVPPRTAEEDSDGGTPTAWTAGLRAVSDCLESGIDAPKNPYRSPPSPELATTKWEHMEHQDSWIFKQPASIRLATCIHSGSSASVPIPSLSPVEPPSTLRRVRTCGGWVR